MAGYAAFLRAINVGGRRVTGADLCAALEDLGFNDVSSFRASGNLVFGADGGSRAKIAAQVEERLGAALGYEVPVFLRTAAEVKAIATERPFSPKQLKTSKGKLQVVLLAKRPSKTAQAKVLELATGDDGLAFGRQELYWLPRAGTQKSELDFKAIGKLIGSSTTVRTKGTVEQIAAKFFSG